MLPTNLLATNLLASTLADVAAERSLPRRSGNYAAGDRFWDREREVAEIAAYLADGQSVLVTGPRRVGKTSVVHRVLGEIEPSTTVLFVDVEHHADPTEMFAALAAAASRNAKVWRRIRTWFGKRLGERRRPRRDVDVGVLKVELQAAMAGSWRDDGRAIVEALAEADTPTVVAIDELPLLVDRILRRDPAEAELLMGTMRGFAEEFRTVRWLVSGSIGLEPVLHRAGLTGTITHLRAYPIDAWDEATTAGAVEALARSTGLMMGAGATDAVHAQPRPGRAVPRAAPHGRDPPGGRAAKRPWVTRRRRRSASTTARSCRARCAPTCCTSRPGWRRCSARATPSGWPVTCSPRPRWPTVLTPADATLLADDLVEDAAGRSATLRARARDPRARRLHRSEARRLALSAPDVVRDWWRQGNELGLHPARRPPAPR